MTRRSHPVTRLDPEVRRELILDAAERVLATRRPAEVTFEEIADAAQVSRGLVYNYFKDRTGLVVAVAQRALRRLDADLAAALVPTDDLGDQVVALGLAYRHHTHTHADTWGLLSRAGLLDHPEVVAVRDERVRRLAGRWGDTAEAHMAAWSITALYEVMALTPLPDDTRPEDLIRFLRDALAPGLKSMGVTTMDAQPIGAHLGDQPGSAGQL